MSFLSPEFALFLAAALAAFYLAPPRWRPLVLLVTSYAFYCSWSLPHALLLASLTGAVYLLALAVDARESEDAKLRWTAVGVTGSIAVLVGFKCASSALDLLRSSWGEGRIDAALLVVAPLGISYYVFKLVGYLLDVYWERVRAERSLLSLALHASFFPQIVSGPIQRAPDFLSQVERLAHPEPAVIATGLRRILFGLFKKLVIADRLAVVVAGVHAKPAAYSSLELLLGAYCFAVQLYADFSGITDIAIGLGQLFGVQGPENFARPYLSRNVQEFWRRWHISLSSWLSDYLFTPLRMWLRNLGSLGLSLAIFLNMVAVGLWHGPTATYLAFGVLNGLFMTVSALTLKRRNALWRDRAGWTRVRAVAAPLLTFHLVVFAFIFFRASSLPLALEYVGHLFAGLARRGVPASRLDWALLGRTPLALLATGAGAVGMEVVHWARDQERWRERFLLAPRAVRWGIYYAAVLLIVFGSVGTQKFIYAQF